MSWMSSMPKRGVARAVLGRPPSSPPSPSSWEWEDTGAALEKIILYPLKSGGQLEVPEAQVTRHGLASTCGGLLRDRMLMAVETGRGEGRGATMLTARRHPSMLLIRVSPAGGGDVRLSAPGMEELAVPMDEATETETETETEVWGGSCRGADLGDAAGEWLREYLFGAESNRSVRLLWHRRGDSTREEHPEGEDDVDPGLRAGDLPLFADMTPFLLMSRESADCIRREVKENNPGASGEDGPDHRRFRPNLVASGAAAPFAEDGWWPAVRVGEDAAVLRACSLCQRCELVNVDPDAGRKTRGGEPLRTLRTFRTPTNPEERRRVGPAPMVGVMMALEGGGGGGGGEGGGGGAVIRVGDRIYVRRLRKP